MTTQIDKDSRDAGETNDCVVRAIAHSCEFSYGKAHAICAKLGRKPRRGVYFRRDILPALQRYISIVDVTAAYDARTILTLACELYDGRYMVQTRGHVLAICNGLVLDWAADRKLRVQAIYRVEANLHPSVIADLL